MVFSIENIVLLIIISVSILSILIFFSSNIFYKNKIIKNIYTLRILFFSILTLILINPKINYTTEKKTKLEWNVYLDNSLSMSYHQQPSATSYVSGVNSFLEKLTKKGVKTNIYNFEHFARDGTVDGIKNLPR